MIEPPQPETGTALKPTLAASVVIYADYRISQPQNNPSIAKTFPVGLKIPRAVSECATRGSGICAAVVRKAWAARPGRGQIPVNSRG